jgi:hypothetical protein
VSKSVVNTEPATIYGLVWHDSDSDGQFDPSEYGEPGIEVMFYEYGEEQTQYKDDTDGAGVFQINIPGPREDMLGRIGPTEYGQGITYYVPNGKELEVPEEEEWVTPESSGAGRSRASQPAAAGTLPSNGGIEAGGRGMGSPAPASRLSAAAAVGTRRQLAGSGSRRYASATAKRCTGLRPGGAA